MKRQICVVGSVNVDMTMRLDRLPSIGETVSGGEFMQTFGGKGANQAVAAARSAAEGVRTLFLACVGSDLAGGRCVENFQRDGIDTTRILRKECPTGTALILFDKNGDNCIAVAPGANHAMTAGDVDANVAAIRSAAWVVLQNEISAEAGRRVLEIAGEAGVRVLFNYAPATIREIPLGSAMTALVVNEVEAGDLCGVEVRSAGDAERAANALSAKGPSIVVITLGKMGVYIHSKEFRGVVPGFPVKAVDATAAGDTFCGAFAAALVEGKPMVDVAIFANAAAALSVTRMGAQPSIPTRAEIEAFIRSGAVRP